jgi:hypothetical protein
MTNKGIEHITPQGSKKFVFPITLGAISLGILLLVYVATLIPRGLAVYDSVKQTPGQAMNFFAVTQGKLEEFVPVLGSRLVPRSTGAWILPFSEPFPFHNGTNGLRAPLGKKYAITTNKRPRILFLGDSFTYGQLVSFDKTFAYQTAAKFGGQSINAGVPGYSLAQMLMHAKQVLPKYQPDYLIVQYSPWLVLRAILGWIPGESQMVMGPYFSASDDTLTVAPAPFVPTRSLLDRIDKYRSTTKGFWDAISFFTEVGIPFYVHHMYHLAIFRTKQLLGLAPRIS